MNILVAIHGDSLSQELVKTLTDLKAEGHELAFQVHTEKRNFDFVKRFKRLASELQAYSARTTIGDALTTAGHSEDLRRARVVSADVLWVVKGSAEITAEQVEQAIACLGEDAHYAAPLLNEGELNARDWSSRGVGTRKVRKKIEGEVEVGALTETILMDREGYTEMTVEQHPEGPFVGMCRSVKDATKILKAEDAPDEPEPEEEKDEVEPESEENSSDEEE